MCVCVVAVDVYTCGRMPDPLPSVPDSAVCAKPGLQTLSDLLPRTAPSRPLGDSCMCEVTARQLTCPAPSQRPATVRANCRAMTCRNPECKQCAKAGSDLSAAIMCVALYVFEKQPRSSLDPLACVMYLRSFNSCYFPVLFFSQCFVVI